MKMKERALMNSWFVCLVMVALLTLSCGTILYPERHGQVSGRVDPGVVVMDGVCLFFFLIPGIIAFAVDFSTGAIYYPPGQARGNAGDTREKPVVFHVDPDSLTREGLAKIVLGHTGKGIDLSDTSLQLYEVERPERLASLFEAASNGRLTLERADLEDCPLYSQRRVVQRPRSVEIARRSGTADSEKR